MKYYRLCFKQLSKQKLWKLLIVYFIIYSMIILVSYLSKFDFDVNLFNIIIGNFQNDTLLSILWMLFQIIFHTYIIYLFSTYDKTNSFEFIILRESNKNIIQKKILLLLAITILFRIIVFLFTYFIFFRSINFPYYSLGFNLCIHIVIVIIASIISYRLDEFDL